MPEKLIAAHILVKGRVQGVGYRYFAQEVAHNFGLKGWVRNLPGGPVETEIEGPRPAIEHFLHALRQGPPMARVNDVEVHWSPPTHQFTTFEIR